MSFHYRPNAIYILKSPKRQNLNDSTLLVRVYSRGELLLRASRNQISRLQLLPIPTKKLFDACRMFKTEGKNNQNSTKWLMMPSLLPLTMQRPTFANPNVKLMSY